MTEEAGPCWLKGATLWGTCENGLINGYGGFYGSSGNFKNGFKNGKGKFKFSDGTVYDGEFKNRGFMGGYGESAHPPAATAQEEVFFMEMKQCPNGHFYDQSKTPECPYCNSASANVNVTRPVAPPPPAEVGETVPLSPPMEHTRPISAAQAQDGERTVAVIKKQIGIDPVVGWLVCIEGKEKGRDYRIHADNNFIGRSDHMDICIRGDDTISRENHARISYDMRSKTFYFGVGEGRSIVRLNDKPLFGAAELKAYDRIELGNTILMFVPFCGEGFNWK